MASVFRISQEMQTSMFKRFFSALKVAFLSSIFERTMVTLDFAYAPMQKYGIQISDVQLLTNLATSSLLALAFITLYVDWRREPVCGSPQTQEL